MITPTFNQRPHYSPEGPWTPDVTREFEATGLTGVVLKARVNGRKALKELSEACPLCVDSLLLEGSEFDEIEESLLTISNLSWLGLFEFEAGYPPINLSQHGRLTHLWMDWSPAWDPTLLPPQLQHLDVRQFTSEQAALAPLGLLKHLVSLAVVESNIVRLGLDRAELRLRELKLSHLPDLAEIESLRALGDTLEVLEFDKCRAIVDWDVMRELVHLRRLLISSCSPLPSVDFVNQLTRLRFFSFVHTEILSKDLRPLLAAASLERIGMVPSRRKGYSHTESQIMRGLSS